MKLYDILDWDRQHRSIRLTDLDTNEILFEEEFARIKEGSVIIDVGARVGYYTIKAGLILKKSGTVLAIEPHPQTYSVLKMNINLYKLKNVIAVRSAVGSKHGKMVLHEGVDSGATTIIPDRPLYHLDPDRLLKWLRLIKTGGIVKIFQKKRKGSPILTPVTTLDAVVEEANIEKVDLIKIDVQGAELGVLKGSLKTLGRDKPRLLIEIHPELDVRLKDVERELRGFGYRLVRMQKRFGSFLTVYSDQEA